MTPYQIGRAITSVLIFIGVWIYAIMTWGFLLGTAFGWLPAAIAAFIGGLIWPLFAIVIALGALALAYEKVTYKPYVSPYTSPTYVPAPRAVVQTQPSRPTEPVKPSLESIFQTSTIRTYFSHLSSQAYHEAFALFTPEFAATKDFEKWKTGYLETGRQEVVDSKCELNICRVTVRANEYRKPYWVNVDYVFDFYLSDASGTDKISNIKYVSGGE